MSVYGHIMVMTFPPIQASSPLVPPGPCSVKPLLAPRCAPPPGARGLRPNKKAAGGKAEVDDLPWKMVDFMVFVWFLYMVLLGFL